MKTVLPATHYQTPCKSGRLVIAPSFCPGTFDSHAADCPFVFFHEGRYWMTYVGWDRIGYRTGLASSPDLQEWKKEGLILDRGPKGSITEYNVALTSIMRDNDLFGPATLKKVQGRYIGTYHAYPKPGYEEGPAVIGLCFSGDLRNWTMGEPVLKPDPECEWEAGGLYKSWLMEHEGTYYLFYNAKNNQRNHWKEQTGVAMSDDLIHWERSPLNPVLPHGQKGDFDELFASDPAVLRDGDQWLMFYFGSSGDTHARNGMAFSQDLLHWEKSGDVLIDVGPAGALDSMHAHKPGIISKEGRLYHFYCAVSRGPKEINGVNVDETRGISFATSTD